MFSWMLGTREELQKLARKRQGKFTREENDLCEQVGHWGFLLIQAT